jgi:hypothetical protein
MWGSSAGQDRRPTWVCDLPIAGRPVVSAGTSGSCRPVTGSLPANSRTRNELPRCRMSLVDVRVVQLGHEASTDNSSTTNPWTDSRSKIFKLKFP